MPKSNSKVMSVGLVRAELEIAIDAEREKVWNAIIEDITLWWSRDFYACADTKRFVIEPHVGGRLYEDAGNGNGVQWYTIIAIDPPKSMNLAGFLAPPYAGPATTLLRLDLESTAKDKTTLKISDSVFGNVDESSAASLDSGWRILFVDGLKKFVEAK